MSQQWRDYLQQDFYDELIGPDGPRPAARHLIEHLNKLGTATRRRTRDQDAGHHLHGLQ